MTRVGAGVRPPWHPDKCKRGRAQWRHLFVARRLRSENAGRPGEPHPDGTGSVPAEEIARVFAIRRPMTLRILLAERSTALLADSGLPRVSNGVVFW